MSKTFNVGDIVRRVSCFFPDGYNGMKIGDTDEVVSPPDFGLVLKKFGRGHSVEHFVLVEAAKPTARQYKIGDKVRRKVGAGFNGGKAPGEEFTVDSVSPTGWVRSAGITSGHNPDKLELVRAAAPADPFGIETVTTSTLKGGEFQTSSLEASVRWADSDSDGDIRVAIDEQYMKPADLRQAADLFKALADKLEGLTA